MALLHMDNFTFYGDRTRLTEGVYTIRGTTAGVSLPIDPDGVSGTRVLSVGSNAQLCKILPSGKTKVFQAFRLWMDVLPNTVSRLAGAIVLNASNNIVAACGVDNLGRLGVATSSGIVATTTTPVMTANGWFHIEAMFEVAGATLNYEVRLEGRKVLEGSTPLPVGVTGPIWQCAYGWSGGAVAQYFEIKDSYICDDTGLAYNDFAGTVYVRTLPTVADVVMDWEPVPAGATGSSILDNNPAVNASYIRAIDPPPAPAVFELANLPDDVTSVRGMMTYVRAAKVDGGDATLQIGLVSGASTGLGADRPITVAQTFWTDVFETDPATNDPWTPVAVDAARLQINRTS